jgi:hypothetical protein
MKTFKDYLTESKKTYEFKIGIAGELPENIEDILETALQKYAVQNMSSGKRTPITERPLDFPQLQNVEVTYYETELQYPTTVQVLQEYLHWTTGIPHSHIIVRNMNEPQEQYQAPVEDKPYESLLNTEDMGGESAQESVGANRVMELLKELEKARSEREADPGRGGPQGDSEDITDKSNSTSPVGS